MYEPHDGDSTGYSTTFSFEEALRNAVSKLAPPAHAHPDQLTTAWVVATGVEFWWDRRDDEVGGRRPAR